MTKIAGSGSVSQRHGSATLVPRNGFRVRIPASSKILLPLRTVPGRERMVQPRPGPPCRRSSGGPASSPPRTCGAPGPPGLCSGCSATPEMEFLDISLTKDSRLLLHAIHSPFYWWILKKSILFSGFKTPRNKKTRVNSQIAFCRTEK
jgi:hypothetical protein